MESCAIHYSHVVIPYYIPLLCLLFLPEVDRVRRQFKCYRDGKGKEIHNLVKKNHELENALRQFSAANVTGNHNTFSLPERHLAPFENDVSIENLSLFKAPGSLEEVRGMLVEYTSHNLEFQTSNSHTIITITILIISCDVMNVKIFI